jgi:hypothetical protein
VSIVRPGNLARDVRRDATGKAVAAGMGVVSMTVRANASRDLLALPAIDAIQNDSGINATRSVQIPTAMVTADVMARANATAMKDLPVHFVKHVHQVTRIGTASVPKDAPRMKHAVVPVAADQMQLANAFPLLIAVGLSPAFFRHLRLLRLLERALITPSATRDHI